MCKRICDNYAECHDLEFIAEGENAARVICKICKEQFILRKDARGIYERRQAAELLKRLILQPTDNLFYKYHPQHLKT